MAISIKFETTDRNEAYGLSHCLCKSLAGSPGFEANEIFVPDPEQDMNGYWTVEMMVGSDECTSHEMEVRVKPMFMRIMDKEL